jgi:hypothetical protein
VGGRRRVFLEDSRVGKGFSFRVFGSFCFITLIIKKEVKRKIYLDVAVFADVGGQDKKTIITLRKEVRKMKVRFLGKTKIASLLAGILVFAFTSGVAMAVSYNMPVYYPTENSSYEILAPSSWQSAEATAVSRGGHLTSIHSAAENNFIPGMTSFWSWIGLYKPYTSWSDGTSVNYTNWSPGEPNNFGGSESAVEIYPTFVSNPGTWNDRTSDGPLPGVAKYAGLRGGVTDPANGHTYYLVGGGDWNQIESWAVGLFGGHLVTINDAAEQAWLEGVFGTDTLYWIGMNDVHTEGIWEWVSGQGVTYTNWAPGEPNNYLGIEDHAVMNWGSGYWNDVAIGSPFITVGIVEVVPEPSTMILLASGLIGLAGYGRKKFFKK